MAASAAAAALSLVIWIASAFRNLYVTMPLSQPNSHFEISAMAGRVQVSTNHGFPRSVGWSAGCSPWIDTSWPMRERIVGGLREISISWPLPEKAPHFEFSRFSFTHPTRGGTYSGRFLAFPLWLPVLLFGIGPAITIVATLRRRAAPHGCCHHCGYDLRGSPSGICPECGEKKLIDMEAEDR